MCGGNKNVCRLSGRWYLLTLGCVDFNVYLCACVICACWVMSASICDMRLCVIHSRVCVG